MTHRRAIVLLWALSVLAATAGASGTYAASDREGDSSNAGQSLSELPVADTGGMTVNPHSDLIFRATGAASCLDCHRASKEGRQTSQVLDNALVLDLRAKAKGIHGPGRFADCLRCHAGGKKGVEKYLR